MSYDLKLPKLEELSQCKEIESFCIELVFEVKINVLICFQIACSPVHCILHT